MFCEYLHVYVINMYPINSFHIQIQLHSICNVHSLLLTSCITLKQYILFRSSNISFSFPFSFSMSSKMFNVLCKIHAAIVVWYMSLMDFMLINLSSRNLPFSKPNALSMTWRFDESAMLYCVCFWERVTVISICMESEATLLMGMLHLSSDTLHPTVKSSSVPWHRALFLAILHSH